MDSATKTALSLLERHRQSLSATGPVRLSYTYLRLIAQAEALPENQSGADKTWVGETQSRLCAHYLHTHRD